MKKLDFVGLHAWKEKGLKDKNGVFKTLFALFFEFPDPKNRQLVFQSLLEEVNTRLQYTVNAEDKKEKAALLELQTICKKFRELFQFFKQEEVFHGILVKPNDPHLVEKTKKVDVKEAEAKRIIFTQQHGFVQMLTKKNPRAITIKSANTFKPGTNIVDINKLLILGDMSKYILEPGEDELSYTGGNPILFCGEVKIDKGKMVYLNNTSDRHTMTRRQVDLTLKHFRKKRVLVDDIKCDCVFVEEEVNCTDEANRYVEFCGTLKRWIIDAKWQRQNSLYIFLDQQEKLIQTQIDIEKHTKQTLENFEPTFNDNLASFKEYCKLTKGQELELEQILITPPWIEVVFKLDDRQLYMTLITSLKKCLEEVEDSVGKTAFFKFLEIQHNSFDNPKQSIPHSIKHFNNALPKQLRSIEQCCSKKKYDELNGILEDKHPDPSVLQNSSSFWGKRESRKSFL